MVRSCTTPPSGSHGSITRWAALDLRLPPALEKAIADGLSDFNHQHRFRPPANGPMGKTPSEQKEHFQNEVFNSLIQAYAEGGRGQPRMIERWYAVMKIVLWLEGQGVPFATSVQSRMNRAVRTVLHDMADRSDDPRLSRRKKITREAVRLLLRDVKRLRALADHFTALPPYAD